jgi:hypothetical protein
MELPWGTGFHRLCLQRVTRLFESLHSRRVHIDEAGACVFDSKYLHSTGGRGFARSNRRTCVVSNEACCRRAPGPLDASRNLVYICSRSKLNFQGRKLANQRRLVDGGTSQVSRVRVSCPLKLLFSSASFLAPFSLLIRIPGPSPSVYRAADLADVDW